jgi:phosphate transport system substrate-binding protein
MLAFLLTYKGVSMKNLAIITAALAIAATSSYARDNVQITGSSTVLPYATIVAEAFGENFDFPTPVVSGGGSGAGRAMLCEGVGINTVDIANSSSKMKSDAWEACEANIGPVEEVRIGYDGIVFASRLENAGFGNLTPGQIYLALSVNSTATNWKEIDPSLPDREILVYIPGTKHGTREVFDIKVMEDGCKAVGSYDYFLNINGGDKKAATAECIKVRTDGVSVDIDGDYTETLARLEGNQTGIGVFGLSFLLNNTSTLYAATINGVTASTETIASGEYPISRPLFFYVKTAHLDVIPGLREYIQFFMSDDMAGPRGPLAEYGLVPDPELAETQKRLSGL